MSNDIQWFQRHEAIVLLTSHMADEGYSAQDIAYAVEKPWKYEDIYSLAVAAAEQSEDLS